MGNGGGTAAGFIGKGAPRSPLFDGHGNRAACKSSGGGERGEGMGENGGKGLGDLGKMGEDNAHNRNNIDQNAEVPL